MIATGPPVIVKTLLCPADDTNGRHFGDPANAGYDPVVVPSGSPIPFPFASALPDLSPDGGQWEIAVGMRFNAEHGVPVFTFGPYVPASSLLTGATGVVVVLTGGTLPH